MDNSITPRAEKPRMRPTEYGWIIQGYGYRVRSTGDAAGTYAAWERHVRLVLRRI